MNVMIDHSLFPIWQGGELRCVARCEETHDSATFLLASGTPACFDYLPGQFVTIGIKIDGAMHHRAYSISSSPSKTDSIAITVKRVGNGLVSNHMLDYFRVGDYIHVGAPAGQFHLDEESCSGRLVFLSAGGGVTPVMSMVRWLLESKCDADIHFIHSARSERDVIYCEELIALAECHPNFRIDLFLSKPEGTLGCHVGRLTPERLDALVKDAAEASIFLCGHLDYMGMIEEWHRVRRLPAVTFHKESFSPTLLPDAELGCHVFELSVPAFGKTAEIFEGQPLLEVLEAEGVPIIAACRSGLCGSCRCKVVEGEVERMSTETLTQEELDAGIVLACSSRARSSLIVDLTC